MAFAALVYGWLVSFAGFWASVGNFFWQIFRA